MEELQLPFTWDTGGQSILIFFDPRRGGYARIVSPEKAGHNGLRQAGRK
jgi:hypothetical protein